MTNSDNENLSRRERERKLHRQEILRAAERVFVRKGYQAANVEEIAQEAEFSVGTLYNFFKSKEEMYIRVVETLAHDFMDMLEERVLSQAEADKAIASLIELRLEHFDKHKGFFRVFLETSPGSQLDLLKYLPESCRGLYDHYIDSVSGIFKRGVQDGQFEDMDPLYLTLCLEGILNAFATYWSKHEPEEPFETRVEKLKEVFIGRLRPRADEDSIGKNRQQSDEV